MALRTGEFAHSLSLVFNTAEFEKFLRPMLRRRSPGRKTVIVVDNARHHHAKMLKPFLQQRAEVLELLFLPPYSPHLAPIERAWKIVRRFATRNLYSNGLQTLVDAVSSRFEA